MKKYIAFLVLFALTINCGVKQTKELLSSGDYDGAMQNAIQSLKSNKEAKGKQDYVKILEEAHAKAKERDLRAISALEKEDNPNDYEEIYNTYIMLNYRQENIRPLLPLKIQSTNKEAVFEFDDYTDKITNSKKKLTKSLYDNSKALMLANNKMAYRRAYDELLYLENLDAGYKDVSTLLEQAKAKGMDYVSVYTKNETNMIIPAQLEKDLLEFSTQNINDPWTIYHSNKIKGVSYDYGMIINFRQINISPEQVKERVFEKEKLIKDGVKNLLDNNGQVVKDSLGNAIKVDNMKTVKISIMEFSQTKSSQVSAKIEYIDYKTNQLLSSFPITSEFVFNHTYATYKGDKRACETDYYPNFDLKAVPFPSSEQMIYDTGEDLKAKIKEIILKNALGKKM